MKTIGLLGGTGWESTVEYYKIINREIAERTGHQHSARIILHSVDFFDISSRMGIPGYGDMEQFLTDTAKQIEHDGAGCLLLCANTLHIWAEKISAQLSIPLIHIADATAIKIKEGNKRKVGLLGTKPTMELPFYKDRLNELHGIDVLIPSSADCDYIQTTIFNEFFYGKFTSETRIKFLNIINKLVDKGAEGIILGCTEIPLLISQKDTPVPLFDTLELHAKAAADFVLPLQ